MGYGSTPDMPLHEESVWAGEFGSAYTKRQTLTVEVREHMLRKALIRTKEINSVIEFGAGTGDNLRALRHILLDAKLTGVEINPDAYHELRKVAEFSFRQSLLDFNYSGTWDMVLTRGLLIHIAPDKLPLAYAVLHKAMARYLLICEYFSPKPRMIPYRGMDNMLWARDFAGELLDRFDDLALMDYGFVYDRDPVAPQDNVTWFLMERT